MLRDFPDERIEDLRSGDETALADFYRVFSESLYRFVYHRVGKDHHAAEDIVQETFICAIRALRDYRGEGSLFAWLKGIAIHRVSDHYRDSRRDLPLSEALWHLDRDYREVLERFDRESLSEETCSREHVRDLVHSTLSSIPPAYATVLGLKYVEGLSVKAIAKRLGKSRKAAESVLWRAKEAFRQTFSVLLQDLAGEEL